MKKTIPCLSICKLEISLMIGLLVSIALCAVSAFAQNCEALRQDVLRLHILANSDEPFDQQIKLEVRDAILREYGGTLGMCEGKAAAESQIAELLPAIEKTAEEVINSNGFDYPVKAQVTNMYFETRTYGSITMPAGMYDAVRIYIGGAKGHNWWCVLYPPVCVPSSADLTSLQQDPVAGGDPGYEPRFKIVEIIEEAKQKLDSLVGNNNIEVDNKDETSYNEENE